MRWSPRERWCLAACAQPTAARNESHEWLGGAPRLVAHGDTARERLAENGIASENDLKQKLCEPFSPADSDDDDSDNDEITPEAVATYERVTKLDLAAQGYLAGFLDEAFVWKHAFKTAAQLRKSFSSWQSLGESYLFGKEIVEGDLDDDDPATLQALLDTPTSPWRRVAFDDFHDGPRSLPSHPRIDPPTAVILSRPARTWTLSLAQRRAQALWAVIGFTDHASLSRLGGWPRTDGFSRGTRAGLQSFRIRDRADLVRSLEEHRKRSSAQDRLAAHTTAWGVTFANWGFLVGDLEEDEAWKWILDFAEDQAHACGSWAEFAEHFMEREKQLNLRSLAMHAPAVERLLIDENSPWRTLGWFGEDEKIAERSLEVVTIEGVVACPSCTTELQVAQISRDEPCAGCGEAIAMDESQCEYLFARDAHFSRRLPENEKRSRLDLGMNGRSRRKAWRGPATCLACAAPLVLSPTKKDFACAACGLAHHVRDADARVIAIDSDAIGILEASLPAVKSATITCASCNHAVVVPAGQRSASCESCKSENILPTRIFKAQTRAPQLRVLRTQTPAPLDLPGAKFQSLTLGDCPPMTAVDALAAEGGDISIVNDSPWKAFARTAADRFALALHAIDTHAARKSFAMLGGQLRTAENAREARKRLKAQWAVTSREQLLERVQVWRDVGVRAELAAYAKWLAENPGDWKAEQLSGGDADKQRKWALVLELDENVRNAGIAALDATWVIGSAGDGYLAGWLTAEQAWEAVRKIARVVRDTYASWEEFVAAQFAGRRFVGMNVDDELKLRAQQLLADAAGPFQRSPWSTDLDEEKRASEDLDHVEAWSVRFGVECSDCGLPMPAFSMHQTSMCTACGKIRQIMLEEACTILRAPLSRARDSTPEKNARVMCIDARPAETFHIDLRLTDLRCPWCQAPLSARSLLDGHARDCATCDTKLTLTLAAATPALDRLHPRLVGVLEAAPREREAKSHFACAGCGADLELHDALAGDCNHCGARNFLGDAAAAKIYGRTAPREAILLIGVEHATPLPIESDAWKRAVPMLSNGEALLTEGT